MAVTPDPFESLARIRAHEAAISERLAFEAHLRNDRVIRERLATAAVYIEGVIDREYEIEYGEANS